MFFGAWYDNTIDTGWNPCHSWRVNMAKRDQGDECARASMTHYPLLFAFRDVVSGVDFLAGITLSGRILMTVEDEKWWVYGVRPAAIAESGTSPQEALLRFRNRYREVLFDIAGEQRSFDSFRKEVERFFYEPDLGEDRKWEDALAKIRLDNLEPPPAFSGFPREFPETHPAQISVERLDEINKRFMPSDNVLDTYSSVAA